MGEPWHPTELVRTHRPITGMSAVLLPYTATGEVDWDGFRSLLDHTLRAGLTPAVNMDTGYVNLLDDDTRDRVLDVTAEVLAGGPFVAGAYVADQPGSAFAPDRHLARIHDIQDRGGTPVLFQSHGLVGLERDDLVEAYRRLAGETDRCLAFELGTMFAPFGRIYDLDTYEALLGISAIIGAKHSSLSRQLEWERLRIRDRVRPDFLVLTGNDLAIDMVMYGSDYLLGLSALAPDLFARRDFCWEIGHPDFYELNDRLQYLGAFAFRPPVPAYKHTVAQFLHLRGWIAHPWPHPLSPRRPEGDLDVLRSVAHDLGVVGD